MVLLYVSMSLEFPNPRTSTNELPFDLGKYLVQVAMINVNFLRAHLGQCSDVFQAHLLCACPCGCQNSVVLNWNFLCRRTWRYNYTARMRCRGTPWSCASHISPRFL